jgi:hypothetical protein
MNHEKKTFLEFLLFFLSSILHQRSTIAKHLDVHGMSILRYAEMFHKNETKGLSEELKNVPPSLTITPSLSIAAASSR